MKIDTKDTASELVITRVDSSFAGEYTVAIRNPYGEDLASATLTVEGTHLLPPCYSMLLTNLHFIFVQFIHSLFFSFIYYLCFCCVQNCFVCCLRSHHSDNCRSYCWHSSVTELTNFLFEYKFNSPVPP